MMTSEVFFQIQSTIIVALLLWGALQARSNRLKHAKIMGFAVIWDLLLIVQIELTRSAIATATDAMNNPVILNIHITLAVTTVILYGLVIRSGAQLIKKQQMHTQKTGFGGIKHQTLGKITLIFRVLTYITSYFTVA